MGELLIYSLTTDERDLRSLRDRLNVAIPDAEPVVDARAFLIAFSRRAESAYEPSEPSSPERGERLSMGMPGPDLVTLVLPAVAGVTAKAAVDVAVDWLRRLRERPRSEKAVVIYGPGGEPLHKVRLRAGGAEPEVFAPPWPRPRT
jgi:hypothetical protein